MVVLKSYLKGGEMLTTEKDNRELCPYHKSCNYLKRLEVGERIAINYRADFCTGKFRDCKEKKRLDDIAGEI